MENRLGIKDFFLFLLVACLMVLIVLAMFQYDRQYRQILLIKDEVDKVAGDVARVRRDIAQGVAFAPGSGGGRAIGEVPEGLTSGKNRDGNADPFYQVREAREAADFREGGILHDNFGTKVGKLTPYISTDVYQRWTEQHLFESLADRDPHTLEFIPRLAAGWEVSEDGLEYTFHLRRNVVFSDGEELTADDVVFTFDWIRNPDVNAPRIRSYLTKLDTVEKLDSHTVRFTFSERYFLNFETVAASPILPQHFYEQYSPLEFNEHPGLVLGSGPYRLESPTDWSPGNGVTLIRNVRYWGEAPAFERLCWDEIQEENVQNIQFTNQTHDVLRCTAEQYHQLKDDPTVQQIAEGFEYDTPYRGYMYIGWNQQRLANNQRQATDFADPRVRRAMTMLVDRERFVREIMFGYGRVASGPFSPIGPQHNPEIEPWPYDVAEARRLLEEAGYRDTNGDGRIERPDGTPFTFTLTYPGGSEVYEKIVLFLSDSFARGGIQMQAERLDWNILVQRLNNSDFDAIILGWSSSPESDPFQIFHSSQIEGQGDNRTHYRSDELDEYIEQARTTMDPEERYKIWHQVHRVIHEDQPYTFLVARQELRFYNKRIGNISRSNVGLNYEDLNGGIIPWYRREQ